MSDNDKKCSNTALLLYIGASLTAIVILIIALYKCDNKKCDSYHLGNIRMNDHLFSHTPKLWPDHNGTVVDHNILKSSKSTKTDSVKTQPPQEPSGPRWEKDDGKPDLTLCAGSGKICANRVNLLNSYLDGNTEYQDLASIQKKLGGPFWKNTNFNHY